MDVSPPTKVGRLTLWQVILKDFGETEGSCMYMYIYWIYYMHNTYVAGKGAMMTGGVSMFNKAASTAYTALMPEEKEKLLIRSQDSGHTSTLSQADIISAGGKIFKKLQSQVKNNTVIHFRSKEYYAIRY